MKNSLQNVSKNVIWEEKSDPESKFNKILEIAIVVLFGLSFFSIPAFSFIGSGRFVTWILVIFLIAAMFFDLFAFYRIKIDTVCLSFLFFGMSAFLSSLFCLFRAFKFTPILLSLLSFAIYCFCSSTKGKFKASSLLFSSFVGVILFLFIFVAKYRNELIHLSFSRLGSLFGDDNDVALFMGFGLISSLYYGVNFRKKTILLNIVCLLLTSLFLLAGLSTGSKIFIFVIALCLFAYPFLIFGRKKWYMAVVVIAAGISLFFMIINLPFFATIKERFASFVSTLIGKNISSGKTGELSTINRFDMFLCGMQMWLRKPMFGWGIWGFATFSGRAGGWSHNNISESFCNFGLIGTVFFHFGFVTSIVGYIKNKKKSNLIFPFVLLLFFMISMVSVALNSQKLYAILIGVIVSCLANEKTIWCCKPRDVAKRHVAAKKCLMEKNICIIGNNARNTNISDGGRIKIRLYKSLLEREGFKVDVIELDGWKRCIVKIIFSIKKAIRRGERIVIMAGPKGCRIVIPLVNAFNKKHKSEVVFCPLGIGTLDYVIKDMDEESSQLFLANAGANFGKKDEKMAKHLKKMDYVIVENDTLLKKYRAFYRLNNIHVLENFRDVTSEKKQYDSAALPLKMIYMSRVKTNKGIFDLLEAVHFLIDEKKIDIQLDIFGDVQLNDEEKNLFFSKLNDKISYKGVSNSKDSISILKKYDLFCLPTKYYGEGTSGALVEAMLSGTPPLVSRYSQVSNLVEDGVTGFVFEFGSVESLIEKILSVYSNRKTIAECGENARIFAEKFTYDYNRKNFLLFLAGEKTI